MPEMNQGQKSAVTFRNGAMLLLAGPGSGKTFVLTHRIKALIDSGVRDTDILVITFTKAAALQMQERFLHLISPTDARVSFGTFHAIFYSILKHHKAFRRVAPITDKEKLNMIRRATEVSGLTEECRDFDDQISALSLISACKNNGNDPAGFSQEMFDPISFEKLFKAYGTLMSDFDLIDFDDMINICLELLKNDAPFRDFWQKKFKYILIDEFQDISSNQYELIKLLAYPEYNVFAVGDDDQSIYSFRGANVGLMKAFLSDMPGAKKEYLSVNYRSSPQIVTFAGEMIKKNTDRFEKRIEACCEDGDDVSIYTAGNREEQNRRILDLICDHAGELSDAAVLVRTNRQGAEYAALLRSQGIECAYNDTHIPFSSIYIKDICAYMAIGAGDTSRESYLRIINKPLRYIKRDALGTGRAGKEELYAYYKTDTHMKKRLDEMFAHLNRLHSMRPYLALKYICNAIGYDRYVKENTAFDKYMEYVEERDAFALIIRDLDTYKQVEDMLLEIRSKSGERLRGKTEDEGVRIMTYHGSKGLEFDTVILPDVNETKIPARSAHTPEAIEEERRMFYVALTRAKRSLNIIYRTDENLRPSRFISGSGR